MTGYNDRKRFTNKKLKLMRRDRRKEIKSWSRIANFANVQQVSYLSGLSNELDSIEKELRMRKLIA